MDAVAAIGLAGNVVQFIEFGCKLFSTSNQIRTSYHGLANDSDTIQVIAADLKQLCEDLKKSINQRPETTQDRHVASLGAQCSQIAERLLDALAKLKPRKGNSRWSCFQAALKTVLKQDEIDQMALQLNGLRMELILRMQFASRPETLLATCMKKVADETRETRVRLTEGLDHFRSELSQMSLHLDSLTDASNGQDHDTSGEKLPAYENQLLVASLREDYLLDLIRLVKGLYFEGSGYRYSKISVAHPKTCEWAYQHRFINTLKSDEPIFWVSGKPGSGKSTFMKFIVDNPRTVVYLRIWAGQRTMITSSYFFWVNGSTMQRSQEGLLRSILLDILLQCPDLREFAINYVKELDRSEWQILGEPTISTSWDLSKLFKLLRLLIAESQATHCLCLFIDGLDEYDGEPQSLIDVLVSLRGLQNVKLCVASRPWNQFENAFGTSQRNKIYMQDLSYDDICVFVRDKFEQSPEFRRMKEESAGIEDLVSEITNRAQGVFLWVRLVVQSLLRGLQNADRIIDLRRRLAEYPPDLDDFFRYIMDSIDPIYHVQVAQGFRAAQAAPKALSILQFWYLDHEDEDPDYATRPTLSAIYAPETLSDLRRRDGRRALDMNKRIAGRFKGFLEVTHETSGRSYLSEEGAHIYEMKVDFLHRTVNDFLATKACQDIMRLWMPASFKVYQSLYKAYLADLKDACARPECIINTYSMKALISGLSHVRDASKAYAGDDLDDLYEELLSISQLPTPSCHGRSLEELCGKLAVLDRGTRIVDRSVLGRDDRTDNAWRLSNTLDTGYGFEECANRMQILGLPEQVRRPAILRVSGDPDLFRPWCFRRRHVPSGMDPIPAHMRQLVDERSLARHLNSGNNVTADEVNYALNSGQLSHVFVCDLLDCVAEARERQLCGSGTDQQAQNSMSGKRR